jgi:hypothetical protein
MKKDVNKCDIILWFVGTPLKRSFESLLLLSYIKFRLLVDILPWMHGFWPRVIHVEFVVDKVFSLDGPFESKVPRDAIFTPLLQLK